MPQRTIRVDALAAQLLAQGGDLAEQRPGRPVQVDPGEPLAGLLLGLRAPQRGVAGEEPARRPRRRPGVRDVASRSPRRRRRGR